MSEAQDINEIVEAQEPKQRAGWVMGWGVVSLVAAQVFFGLGFVESMSGTMYSRANPAPFFLVGFVLGAAGLGGVLTAFSRLSANVEYLALAERLRRIEARPAGDVVSGDPDTPKG